MLFCFGPADICNLARPPTVLPSTTPHSHPNHDGLVLTLADFELTVTQHQNRVHGYAARLLGDRDQAADVVQECMLRLWRHRDTVRPDGAISWLLRVTHNACIDALRRRKREQSLFRDAIDSDTLGGTEVLPDRAAESSDLRDHIETALRQLSEPYRSIVILREVEDFSYEEICGALDLPMTTVKVYLHRGRHKLRKLIEEVLHREHV